MVKTRVRYIRWTYYPEFHLVSPPRDYWWHTIRYDSPKWKSRIKKDEFYLDDLFFDREDERFWMLEPYLSKLPKSEALFRELGTLKFEWPDHLFQKIDPLIVDEFKNARKTKNVFIGRRLDREGSPYRRQAYGSKGWQERIKMLPKTSKIVRLRR